MDSSKVPDEGGGGDKKRSSKGSRPPLTLASPPGAFSAGTPNPSSSSATANESSNQGLTKLQVIKILLFLLKIIREMIFFC